MSRPRGGQRTGGHQVRNAPNGVGVRSGSSRSLMVRGRGGWASPGQAACAGRGRSSRGGPDGGRWRNQRLFCCETCPPQGTWDSHRNRHPPPLFLINPGSGKKMGGSAGRQRRGKDGVVGVWFVALQVQLHPVAREDVEQLLEDAHAPRCSRGAARQDPWGKLGDGTSR